MAYLNFNKAELVNLEYSLEREMLATTRTGGYSSTTIVGCNTRKYHGLLVVPIEEFGGENHVLLSSLDETIVQHEQPFNLGIHRYPNTYEPRGHKYIIDFAYEPIATITYRVGGVILKKEMMLVHNEDTLFIRYTLLDAHSPTTLRLKPFLAYRNIHKLSKANPIADTRAEAVTNGIKSKLYSGYPSLHLQVSKANGFVAAPDWYYNVEYREELRRGYEGHEDLFSPGYIEFPIKKGESIIVSASVNEQNPAALKKQFAEALAVRPPRDSYINCLKASAAQFIIQRKNNKTEVVAGYPWFGRWGRDTFISLPGLTLTASYNPDACKRVLDTMSGELQGGLFPNIGEVGNAAYNSVDAPMWYFWAIQQYAAETGNTKQVWKDYGANMKAILAAYRDGTSPNIRMHDNGLVWAEEPGKALTWMDAIVHGVPVTPRNGYQVEINALWYNAICYTLELARANKDTKFVKEWSELPALIEKNYLPTFWLVVRKHLADYVGEEGQNVFMRPNQIIACSLPYSPISDDVKRDVLQAVEKELLTPRGLRTLAPKNPLYKGHYEGDQPTRDQVYHQGTVWPWLLGPYIEANLRLHGKQFVATAKELVAGFEEDMTTYGLCSIPEIYDGDPPYAPNGCISQAWSVAAILHAMKLIQKFQDLKF